MVSEESRGRNAPGVSVSIPLGFVASCLVFFWGGRLNGLRQSSAVRILKSTATLSPPCSHTHRPASLSFNPPLPWFPPDLTMSFRGALVPSLGMWIFSPSSLCKFVLRPHVCLRSTEERSELKERAKLSSHDFLLFMFEGGNLYWEF